LEVFHLFPNYSHPFAWTGISFCYNTVRYLAAAFPLMLGALNASLLERGVSEPFRKSPPFFHSFSPRTNCLDLAPETKGKPLPKADFSAIID